MIFKCRHGISTWNQEWREIEADNWVYACYHFADTYSGFSLEHSYPGYVDSEGRSCSLQFALVEIEEMGKFITRMYYYGMTRKRSAVRLTSDSEERLKKIAETMGWTKDPESLLGSWGEEESYEEAIKRSKTYQ